MTPALRRMFIRGNFIVYISQGWFNLICKCSGLWNLRCKGEAASVDSVAAALIPGEFNTIVVDKEFSVWQVCRVDKTGLI